MELQELSNFIAIAETGNITKAAKRLHISQPALSRQLQSLEKELGVKLAERDSRHLYLTENGNYFLQRAKEVLAMVDKTKYELHSQNIVSGDVYLGCGETQAMHLMAKVTKMMRERYPETYIHLFSGSGDQLRYKLQAGLLDFALLIDPTDTKNYDFLSLNASDTWGILMHPTNPLTSKKVITPADVDGIPSIFPRQKYNFSQIENWLGHPISDDQIIGTYNLLFNAAVMVQEDVGMVYCLDRLINIVNVADLVYRPLSPALTTGINFIWLKNRTLSSAAAAFLEIMQEVIGR
ncbi:LysR family transcriptional regulator [Xylocopilactobacillus apicola]|uniref:LysR family transcriptional regulator n=1 Tax=Xylocopilactobacillus apicola TaxID=2932184 RepID=A0AAU9DSB5_9LACO|nr:LysR family transcriptional regulator [Xylocopilactobacillus apicola]BDR58909.1 LysR family transcriptional regulator [Xylocopilactobacillus apicola]